MATGDTVQEIRDTFVKKMHEVRRKIQEKSQEESCKMSDNDDCAIRVNDFNRESEEQRIRVNDFNRESEEQSYWEEKSMMRAREKSVRDVLTGIIQVSKNSENSDLLMGDTRQGRELRQKIELGYKQLIGGMDTTQEFRKKTLRLARYGEKSEFTRREAMERWRDPEEELLDENWPGRASFDPQDGGSMPELFSRKKTKFQARYERQKVSYARQAVCERERSECDDEDEDDEESKRMRKYRCFYCKETGHIARNCQLKSTASNASVCEDKTSEEENMKKRTSAFIAGDIEKKQQISEYTWLGDFSTACHVTNSLEGLYDTREVIENIKFINGNEEYAMKIGKVRATVQTQEGKPTTIILDEVRYVPGFYAKLFSMTRAMAKIWSEGATMTVELGTVKLEFGRCRNAENDFMLGLELKPIQYDDTTMATAKHKKSQVLMNRSKETAKKWKMYQSLCENRVENENFDDNGNETLESETEDNEIESDRDFLREGREKSKESNDVKRKCEEASYDADTVMQLSKENFRDFEGSNSEKCGERCENDEITKVEPSESIEDIKDEDSTKKNERKARKNDGELDDYGKETKTDDDTNESDKRMQVDDKTTDFNDYFLESGQFKYEEEDYASGFTGEVEETIENKMKHKMAEKEQKIDESEVKYEFGRDNATERHETTSDTIVYEKEKHFGERIMKNNEELTEICGLEVCNKNDNCGSCSMCGKEKLLEMSAMKVAAIVLSIICIRLIVKMRRAKQIDKRQQWEVIEMQWNENEEKFSNVLSDDWTRDWYDQDWSRGVMREVMSELWRITDCKSWRYLIRNGMLKKRESNILKRTLIWKFTRMRPVEIWVF